MSKISTKKIQRPKDLPFSNTILDRLRKQCEIGLPEISEMEFLQTSSQTKFLTNRYQCSTLFQQELDLLKKRPYLVSFSDQVPNPGDFISGKFLDREWLVLRNENKNLRLYRNSCLHRGTRLVSRGKTGSAKKIVCPYHSWTYDLNGDLLTKECETIQEKLYSFPVLEKAGLIFSGFTENVLDSLSSLWEEWKVYELDSYIPFAIQSEEGAYNWKIGVEIFLESYHISTVHKNSVASVVEKNVSIMDPIGEHARILIPNRSYKNTSRPTRKDLIITYFLFPSTILILFRDHFGIIQFQPISPDRTFCLRAILIPEKPKSSRTMRFWEENREFFFRTTSEDLGLAPEIQTGVLQNEWIQPSSLEPGIFHFHNSLTNAFI
ncbi:Rieske 2Fe-2S domain-containing protein [Leptospira interrogans]|uniref:Ring hydroxylating dioxygenase alpha-subunit n=8 Tax=Leptospira interrogans TaxID=173 RepID=Q8F734_LEPIN|nr:Rieske 2Fe-2S domain-containing protein [Leptospira interrogans]APH42361.1 Ribosomal subunit interface protein [Leptospira interrogans serovar Copenhageni/Icterohaemorrhagiae]EMF71047.1 ring hydroxylating alpha subunit, catalytic domain protein [Leptospira interrogans serovar Canicola str. LT1962]EMG20173.1 ring hydroxylating alpha subunit, catalytic domain protein [Leptospira interrogans serovar Copenhageni str. LT2050]EMO05326.1 ring hydroxylating alpha subunit, catalytic domain protein [L